MGNLVRAAVGDAVRFNVGEAVGDDVELFVGDAVGEDVGEAL